MSEKTKGLEPNSHTSNQQGSRIGLSMASDAMRFGFWCFSQGGALINLLPNQGTPPESRATPGLRQSPPEQDRNGGERKKTKPKGWRWWLGGFRSGQDKRKRKAKEGRRVAHTTRSDQSGHDLPHLEVRVRRVATSKGNKGSKEEREGDAR
uniref:Uncharacterized protein n=1 Tax=Fagus sylvatica TaxID=28930 RepID=A0A2N9J8U5_FAGSY